MGTTSYTGTSVFAIREIFALQKPIQDVARHIKTGEKMSLQKNPGILLLLSKHTRLKSLPDITGVFKVLIKLADVVTEIKDR